jgi:hypothetical protein
MKKIIGAGVAVVTVVAAAVGAVVFAPAANAAAGCRVVYTVQSQWAAGFTANVAVTNLGDPVNGWTLRFAFAAAGQSVTQGWGATWTQSGASVSATSLGWNSALGTNVTVGIGFNGTWSGSNPAPTSFSLNNVTCTGAVVPTTAGPNPPAVALTSPAPGATFVAPAAIPLAATASSSGSTINRVEFYAGTTLLATDTTAPYGFTWQNAGGPAGSTVTVTLTARAFDNQGQNRTSTPVTITVLTPGGGNRPPTVVLFDPTNRPTVVAPMTIIMYATVTEPDANDVVNRCELYLGSTLVATQANNGGTNFVFQFFLTTPGTYVYTARAYDSRGGIGTSNSLTIVVT